MKIARYLYTTLCIGMCCFILSACTHASDVAVKKRFPSTFLEKGNDNDHSYISLKSYRLDNDYLKLELTGWGVEQTGLFLNDIIEGDVLVMHVMGECGTYVPPPIYEKHTFTYTVSTSLEDQLNLIRLAEIELSKE